MARDAVGLRCAAGILAFLLVLDACVYMWPRLVICRSPLFRAPCVCITISAYAGPVAATPPSLLSRLYTISRFRAEVAEKTGGAGAAVSNGRVVEPRLSGRMLRVTHVRLPIGVVP